MKNKKHTSHSNSLEIGSTWTTTLGFSGTVKRVLKTPKVIFIDVKNEKETEIVTLAYSHDLREEFDMLQDSKTGHLSAIVECHGKFMKTVPYTP